MNLLSNNYSSEQSIKTRSLNFNLKFSLISVQPHTQSRTVSKSPPRASHNRRPHVPNLQAKRAPGRLGLHTPDNDDDNPAAESPAPGLAGLQQGGLRGLHGGANQDPVVSGLHHSYLPGSRHPAQHHDGQGHAGPADTVSHGGCSSEEGAAHRGEAHIGHGSEDEIRAAHGEAVRRGGVAWARMDDVRVPEAVGLLDAR